MFGFSNIFRRIKSSNKSARLLYLAVLMLFFFCLFDGLLTNLMPLLMTQNGISETLMGTIIGFSAMFGLFFDFWLCRLLKNVHYRRIYLLMFLIAAVFLLLLWQAETVTVFLLGMALWGLYYDLFSIANIDLVTDTTTKSDYSSGFGWLRVFVGLGYLVATVVAGFFMSQRVGASFFVTTGMVWILAMIVWVVLNLAGNEHKPISMVEKKIGLGRELGLWSRIGRRIFPVLLITFLINVIDAFFWVVGPLLVHDLLREHSWGAWFITLYLLPLLITGWLVGRVSARLGKKKTALVALGLGFVVLGLFVYFDQSGWLLVLSFLSSFFISFAWPAVTGAYADYVQENPALAREIETLQDSFTNLGFVVGPVLAGWLAESYGHVWSFSVLGWMGLVMVTVLWLAMPRRISLS
ncbi:MAG: MFS transporter [Patescibacteria group bacterium]